MRHGWPDCSTKRGTTKYNGAQCHCQRLCEAGHAALTPNLQDDLLPVVVAALSENCLEDLPPLQREFFETRFSLESCDIHALNSRNSDVRKQRVEKILNRLQPEEYFSTFSNTSIEKIRNATFANPRASNRVDCFLEGSLIDLEEKLAEQCGRSEITPREALFELQRQYQVLLSDLRARLVRAKHSLESLESSHEELRQAQRALLAQMREFHIGPKELNADGFFGLKEQEPSFESILDSLNRNQKEKLFSKASTFLEKINDYCGKYKERLSFAQNGTVDLTQLKKNLARTAPQLSLKRILEKSQNNLESALRIVRLEWTNLQSSQNLSGIFERICDELALRIDEVDAQAYVVFSEFNEIYDPIKETLYASLEAGEGTLNTPPQNEIGRLFLSFIKQLTPSRSDLCRKKTAAIAQRVLLDTKLTSKEEDGPVSFASPLYSVSRPHENLENVNENLPKEEDDPASFASPLYSVRQSHENLGTMDKKLPEGSFQLEGRDDMFDDILNS